eukprot:364062-Chlamydomonas_euryale.AAC.12
MVAAMAPHPLVPGTNEARASSRPPLNPAFASATLAPPRPPPPLPVPPSRKSQVSTADNMVAFGCATCGPPVCAPHPPRSAACEWACLQASRSNARRRWRGRPRSRSTSAPSPSRRRRPARSASRSSQRRCATR